MQPKAIMPKLAMNRSTLRISLVLFVIALSACDFWPRDLEQLSGTITEQVGGKTTSWLVGGDVVVVSIEGSPIWSESLEVLEFEATEIATQAIGSVEVPLESIVITFYEGEATEQPEKMREFIFLVIDDSPVLQPAFDLAASGPMTVDELQTQFLDRMEGVVSDDQRACILNQAELLANRYGDPETLDPAEIEHLSNETWHLLDGFSKRLILGQAIITEASFSCIQHNSQ